MKRVGKIQRNQNDPTLSLSQISLQAKMDKLLMELMHKNFRSVNNLRGGGVGPVGSLQIS